VLSVITAHLYHEVVQTVRHHSHGGRIILAPGGAHTLFLPKQLTVPMELLWNTRFHYGYYMTDGAIEVALSLCRLEQDYNKWRYRNAQAGPSPVNTDSDLLSSYRAVY